LYNRDYYSLCKGNEYTIQDTLRKKDKREASKELQVQADKDDHERIYKQLGFELRKKRKPGCRERNDSANVQIVKK